MANPAAGRRALWEAYLAFSRAELPDTTSRATFDRLCAEDEDMLGLLALDDAGRGIGLAHCVLHATTWSPRPTCYPEYLFVEAASRGHDVGRGAGGVSWHTRRYSGRARSLYDQVGRPTPFVVYEI